MRSHCKLANGLERVGGSSHSALAWRKSKSLAEARNLFAGPQRVISSSQHAADAHSGGGSAPSVRGPDPEQIDVRGLGGYTEGTIERCRMPYMKTAISIDEDLYRKAEKLSAKLNLSRSRLFAQALEYLLEKSETLEIIQRLNEVYGPREMESKETTKAAKRKMKGIVAKW